MRSTSTRYSCKRFHFQIGLSQRICFQSCLDKTKITSVPHREYHNEHDYGKDGADNSTADISGFSVSFFDGELMEERVRFCTNAVDHLWAVKDIEMENIKMCVRELKGTM